MVFDEVTYRGTQS